MKTDPPPLELSVHDFIELAKKVQPADSEWDRIYRMLGQMFETLQDIQLTQRKQIEVAEQTCARLTILEGKVK